jgi:hypothetical protein
LDAGSHHLLDVVQRRLDALEVLGGGGAGAAAEGRGADGEREDRAHAVHRAGKLCTLEF